MTATIAATDQIRQAMRAVRRRFLLDAAGVTEVWLVRHADAYEQPLDEDGVFDPCLSPLGRGQAELIGRRVAEVGADVVYTSPARRAVETAAPACRLLGLPAWTIDDLRELRLTGVAGPEAMRAVLGRLRAGAEAAQPVGPHTGEDREAGARRIGSVIDALVERHPGERVVAFSHGAAINAYLAAVLGVGTPLYIYPEYTGVSIVRGRGGERSVLCINDAAHLQVATHASL